MPLKRLERLAEALQTIRADRPVEWTDRPGIVNPSVVLTTENREETRRVLEAVRTGRKTGLPATAGHWQRKVE